MLLAPQRCAASGRAAHQRRRRHCSAAAAGNSDTAAAWLEQDAAAAAQVQALQLASKRRLADLLAASSASAADAVAPLPGSSGLREQIVAAQKQLCDGLVERETEVSLLLLAVLSGEHLLLLGPPGTAKSEICRRLGQLSHGTFFERLLTRFSVPEELFGPLSLRALEEDRYERQTDGYLPTASGVLPCTFCSADSL